MQKDTLPGRLPPSLYRFFWDIDASRLDPSAHAPYVINRLLDKGDLEGARWVLHNFPRETIMETFRTRRDFSPRVASFWVDYLGIPIEEVKCMKEPYRSMRKQRWQH